MNGQTTLPAALDALLLSIPGRGRPARIVVFGNYGNGNLGDEAILSAVLASLRPRADVTVMSRHPERVVALHGNPSENAMSLAGVRALLRSDVVAIGGGGIFGNNMALLPKLLPLLALTMRLLGKSVVFLAIGAYTTMPGWLKPMLRMLARSSAMTTVRDAESAAVLGANSIVVPDPGMSIAAASPAEVETFLSGLGVPDDAPLIAVSLKPAADARIDVRQTRIAVDAIDRWLTCGAEHCAVLLCLSARGDHGLGLSRSDRTLADEVRQDVVDRSRVFVIEATVTPWLMKGVIARSSAVIAHRLHAQMFAVDERRPLLGMSWERKSDQFLDQAGITRIDLRREDVVDAGAWLDSVVPAPLRRVAED